MEKCRPKLAAGRNPGEGPTGCACRVSPMHDGKLTVSRSHTDCKLLFVALDMLEFLHLFHQVSNV